MGVKCYLGVDVGSVSTKLVALGDGGNVLHSVYGRTEGAPIRALQMGLRELGAAIGDEIRVAGVGVTGSGRQLAGLVVGADVVKNEITAQAVAVRHLAPGARTIIEIGGQDSKMITLKDGLVVDFAMNSVCAAGTGSLLDQQAARLGIPIEELGEYALRSRTPVNITGRCGVFAESEMIQKQQLGHRKEDVIAGLCEAVVRNYLSNLGRGKEILPPVLFQGGVAANIGIRAALEKALGCEVTVPLHFKEMGAVGAALLTLEQADDAPARGQATRFKGFGIAEADFRTSTFICEDCSDRCEVVRIEQDGTLLGVWGCRCEKWSEAASRKRSKKPAAAQ